MCGRFTLTTPADVLARIFGITHVEATDEPRYNIAPTQPVLTIRPTEGGRELVALRWGLIPFWAKPGKRLPLLINARAETVATKPVFREAFKRRRCLIPADGFFEWQGPRGDKQPWLIRTHSEAPLALAGVWERARPEGEEILSCAIVTTEAAEEIQHLHDRMPVILSDEGQNAWLETDTEPDQLRRLLKPTPPGTLKFFPVSRRVNKVDNDDSGCIAPLEPDTPESTGTSQLPLFD